MEDDDRDLLVDIAVAVLGAVVFLIAVAVIF